MLLIIAFFTGAAALARFDQGKTTSAWFLAVITVALVLGAAFGRDD